MDMQNIFLHTLILHFMLDGLALKACSFRHIIQYLASFKQIRYVPNLVDKWYFNTFLYLNLLPNINSNNVLAGIASNVAHYQKHPFKHHPRYNVIWLHVLMPHNYLFMCPSIRDRWMVRALQVLHCDCHYNSLLDCHYNSLLHCLYWSHKNILDR